MNKKIMKKAIISILLLITGAVIGVSWKASIDAKKRCENQEVNRNLKAHTKSIQTSKEITDGKQLSSMDLELDRTASETMNFNLRDIREKVERQAILRALT